MAKTALVTGGTRGIGRALVELLTQRGVTVFTTGRDAALLEEVCDRTGAFGEVFDLAEASAPMALYAAAREVLGGPPDFLVNNAGFNARKAALSDFSDEELDRHYAVNLRAPLLLCREVLRDLRARPPGPDGIRGHIVNVLSTVVHVGVEAMGVYTASKAGLHGATRVLVKEARPFGIKVTAVYPGGTDSEFRAAPRPDYMRAESAARMLVDVLFAPDDVVVHELTFRPLVETNF